jgi:hypothetical protein
MISFWTLRVIFLSLQILAKRLFLAEKANSEFVDMLFASYNLVFCSVQINQ